MARRRFFQIAAAIAMSLAGTMAAPASATSETLRIVATTGMIADAARKIGGDAVEAVSLMGNGVDPHSYRQTRSDIVAMTRADLVLWHGLYLEAQLEDFMRDLAERKTVVAVAESLPQDRLISHDDYADKFDPHVWMDPTIWSDVVIAIRDAMIAARPEDAARFEANATAYLAEVAALADYSTSVLTSTPAESRILLTAHDAFNYFGSAYGFDVVGVQGISTESEAGLNRIGELVDLLVDRRIRAVFVETSVSDRNVRALIEGAAARGWTVEIGGELFSDAMGPPETYEGSYLGMIDHNVTTIARALGGEAPEGGRLGRLSES